MVYIGIGQVLLLLLVANGAPILAAKLLQAKFAYPVDGGRHFFDGRRCLGPGKTWRGILASIALTTGVALCLNLPITVGIGFAVLTLLGDLIASFCKRRLAYPESGHAPGWDTLPESLLPLLSLQNALGINTLDIVITVFAFFLMEELFSPFLYRWHIRRRPY